MHCCLESHVSPSQHRFLLAAADFDGAREQELITGGVWQLHTLMMITSTIRIRFYFFPASPSTAYLLVSFYFRKRGLIW